jgi:hypothetical protein
VKEAVQADVDDPPPLLDRHAGHEAVGVDAGVVHQHLDGAVVHQRLEPFPGLLGVGNIEHHAFGRASRAPDVFDDVSRALRVIAGMYDDVHARGGQLSADRGADVAAAAGDERPLHGFSSMRS